MHPVDLISAAIGQEAIVYPYPDDPREGTCCVTGAVGLSLPRAALLGPSFTAVDLLAAPQSDRIGVPAWRAFTWHERRPGKSRGFHPERMSAWWTDGVEMRLLDRQGVRAMVLGPLSARPWAGYATTSYKKHGALFARINGGASRLWAWDDRRVDLTDTLRMRETWERLNVALRAGIGRQSMESLDPPAPIIAKIGLRTWMDFEAWARPRYLGAMYQFLAYLLPSQEELRADA